MANAVACVTAIGTVAASYLTATWSCPDLIFGKFGAYIVQKTIFTECRDKRVEQVFTIYQTDEYPPRPLPSHRNFSEITLYKKQ